MSRFIFDKIYVKINLGMLHYTFLNIFGEDDDEVGKMDYKILLATEDDIEEFHKIIISRCKWFEEKNINQWKVTSYPIRYNINYFKEQMNNLYIIKNNNEVLGGFLLKDNDEKYWSDSNNVKAYYIHHLATKIGIKGLGKLLISFAINKSKQDKKDYLRLDCVALNKKLNEYYRQLGFVYSGKIQIKNWCENLWQIKL